MSQSFLNFKLRKNSAKYHKYTKKSVDCQVGFVEYFTVTPDLSRKNGVLWE